MSEAASGAYLTGRPYRIVTNRTVDPVLGSWPATKTLTDMSGANPERVYAGEAHGEASHAGIQTCLDIEDWHRMPTPMDCGACAVEEGLAVMIQWDREALAEGLRKFSLAKAKAHTYWARENHKNVVHTPRLTCSCGDWNCASLDTLEIQPRKTTGTEQVESLGGSLIRHAIDLRQVDEGLDSIEGSCGERVTPEQLGAWFSPDPEAWSMFVEAAVWCTECFKDVDLEDEDEDMEV